MSEKFRQDRKIGFQNTFYTKCINVIIDSIGPSIILRSNNVIVFSANGLKNLTTWLVSRTVVLSELLDHSVIEIVIPNKTLFVRKDRSLVSLPEYFFTEVFRESNLE